VKTQTWSVWQSTDFHSPTSNSLGRRYLKHCYRSSSLPDGVLSMDARSQKPNVLPLELLRLVFVHLLSKDLKNLRLTCKILANFAAEFLLPEVHLVFAAKSITRLKRISLHPVFSQHVTSIFYEGDHLDFYDSPREWKAKIGYGFVGLPRPANGSTEDDWVKAIERKLSIGWKSYIKLFKQQANLQDNLTDEREITRAILRFPKLDTIRLCLDSALSPPSSYLKESFKESLVIPQEESGLYPFEPPGLRQYQSLMRGYCVPEKFDPEALLACGIKLPSSFDLAKSTMPLRVLHLGGVSWFMFKATPPPVMSAIITSLRHLVDLKLILETGHNEDGESGSEIEMCRECLDKGPLLGFVSSALDLEKLHIYFDAMYPSDQAASLEDVVGNKTWPKLSHLTIGNVFAPTS